jgi:hypothetical protein
MGQPGKASDVLGGPTKADVNGQPPIQPSMTRESETTSPQDVYSLSALELIYRILEEDGMDLVGDPGSAFATFDHERGVVIVFAERQALVHIVPYRTETFLAAINCAQNEGANFSACGNQVICAIGDVSARGPSYAEAALRALFTYKRKANSD